MTYNVNITGTLTNNNGVLSGFSSSDYATVNTPFNPSSNNWVIQLGLTTGNSVSGTQFFLGEPDNSTASVIMCIQDSYFVIALRGEGGSEIETWYKISYIGVDANTKYYIRISYSGSAGYEIQTSPNETSWTTIYTNNSTSTVGMPSDLMLGVHGDASSPFQGSIDLNDCYIEVDNTIVWRGVSQTYNGVHIQLRRDTTANWTTANPTLYDGEVGLITDQAQYVVGDGTSTFSSLTKHNMDTDISNLADTSLSNLTNTGKIAIAHNAMPSNTYTDLTLGASGSTYTAPADGYYLFDKEGLSGGEYAIITTSRNAQTIAQFEGSVPAAYFHLCWLIPVAKGDALYTLYTLSGATTYFRFIYAQGSESEAS